MGASSPADRVGPGSISGARRSASRCYLQPDRRRDHRLPHAAGIRSGTRDRAQNQGHRREWPEADESAKRARRCDGSDVRQAEQLLYTATAQIAATERAIAETENTLNVLLGQNPANSSRQAAGGVDRSVEIPAGLPSDLLERRPDIRAGGAEPDSRECADRRGQSAIFSRKSR